MEIKVKLTEEQIKDIERQLDLAGDLYFSALNDAVKEHNRGFCQGIAIVLAKMGYVIEWDRGKSTVVDED